MIRRAPHRGDSAGESLLELLVAVTLLGTASVTVLGAFGTLIKTSNAGTKSGAVATTLAAAAESVADNARNAYDASCAANPAYNPINGVELPAAVRPADVTIAGVRYWNGAGAGFTATCLDTTEAELRLQLITVRVRTADGSADRTVDVVKRG